MDSSAAEIVFDGNGVCNFCTEFIGSLQKAGILESERAALREKLIDEVKRTGRGKEYDCVVGLSGGADSSYALYLAKEAGLRPLAVHLDNGWNSELAVKNIENLVKKLGVDLYTHVVEWEEFRDLQRSFFKANVVDIELLTDNAMLAINYFMARKHGVKFILAGTNRATEGMRMPGGWNHPLKLDAANIRGIQRRFGSVKIKTFPIMGTKGYLAHRFIHGIQWVSFLDYFDYHKAECMELLEQRLGFRRYPYKHYESVFTRFYQGYILPRKFGIDKRRVHLSSLICSGQMSRAQALELMAASPYPDEGQMAEDRAYFLKKMGFSEEEFRQYLATPGVPHGAYPSEQALWDSCRKLYGKVKRREGM